ncbi:MULTISPECIES: acyl carrier protein [Clostridium]|jgi:acyl carrier protein|uniref:Acyl carrier protein n=2 Tax=Clostridium TaxID=1485 RepID=A0A084J8W1_9CLOT|nr:acyl carrier protein [Clostridium sulfidigenes]KEZ85395.1 acyl carrier protein [Clostridium sulfidigenes]MBE6059851.1 acyl carrier protein [Clostridium sulfidigenes]HBA03148.1 acyl carrier protein [Clostridium sp.]HCO74537.1 acyl carrier protein [Clostridium sp.]
MVLERVKKVIAKELGVEVEELNIQASFTDDLGIDSLEIFEIVMSLEEEFDIEIPNEDIENIKNVQDISSYIESKVN